MREGTLRKYARLIVRVGANVKKKQKTVFFYYLILLMFYDILFVRCLICGILSMSLPITEW